MNRYSWWQYTILGIALVVGLLYTAPNFFGEAPAVQVSSAKVTLKVDSSLVGRVEQILRDGGLQPDFVQLDGHSVKARFGDLDAQQKAKDALTRALNPNPEDPAYIVALNLLSRSPAWLTSVRALPMYLGLLTGLYHQAGAFAQLTARILAGLERRCVAVERVIGPLSSSEVPEDVWPGTIVLPG